MQADKQLTVDDLRELLKEYKGNEKIKFDYGGSMIPLTIQDLQIGDE
jgi:hypothetical protein